MQLYDVPNPIAAAPDMINPSPELAEDTRSGLALQLQRDAGRAGLIESKDLDEI